MGLFRKNSSRSVSRRAGVSSASYAPSPSTKKTIVKGNPDPNNWKIIGAHEEGKYLVVKINYPDCTNYEGDKILVFEDVKLLDVINQKLIDPHFFQSKKYKSPIARFEPTPRGWLMATNFVKNLTMTK